MVAQAVEMARNAAEVALRLSEWRYRNIFDSADVCIWEEDLSAIKARIDAVRGIVDDLRPGDLSHVPLQDAIAAHARLLTALHQIALSLALDPAVAVPASAVRDLYRIAQEALANAIRHGRPRVISIALQRDAAGAVLEVADDGVGFEVGRASAGNGLSNMRERAAALGDDIAITSRAGGGTRVRVTVPVAPSRLGAASA